MSEIPRSILVQWASAKPTISALYVFGSYARGEAHPGSDLDLAFEFVNAEESLSELITKAARWKQELSSLTGIVVKDLYLASDAAAAGPRVEVFRR